MTLQMWTFLIVGATFALYLGIAFWSRAGTTGEFYVAGGGIHPVANGMATAADWMSAASFIDRPSASNCSTSRCRGVRSAARWLRCARVTNDIVGSRVTRGVM